MPRVPQPTAQGRPAEAGVPTASPWQFGAQAFGQLEAFGESIEKAAHAIKERQDELNLTRADDAYRVRMADVMQTVTNEPDTMKHRDLFDKGVADAQQEVRQMYGGLSAPAQQVLERVFSRRTATAQIETAHLTQKMGVEQVLVDSDQLASARIERAATSDRETAAGLINEIDDHRNRNVAKGMMSPKEAAADAEKRQHDYWTIFAQSRPGEFLALPDDVSKTMPMRMDPTKRQHYANIAVNAIRQNTAANELAVKQRQDQTARELTADALEGKPVQNQIPDLLRSGALSKDDGTTIAALERTLLTAPDPSHYVKGMAGGLEAIFRRMKYSTEPLPSNTETRLVQAFNDGKIVKDEMTHLMSVWQSTVDHRSQQGKEGGNQIVTHAHANLIRSLRTTGPADKFDALSEQTITEAERFYYNRLESDPKADPWKVMKEAESIFKPVIKDRLNMSTVDQSALDDAKMQALLKSKAITPAAYKAWQRQKIEREMTDLSSSASPPIPETGGFQEWVDSLKQWWPKPEGAP
jgi:hypothetical protein